jgi:RNA polymerase sigma-70 factor (ECF subfamily)
MTNRERQRQLIGVASAPDPKEDTQPAITLDDIFRMHAGYVWNTLRRLGVAPSDVQDLTHDVFVQVHARLGDYDPRRPARPWLFGFAFRVAAQYRRRAHRRYEVSGEPDHARAPESSAEDRVVSNDERRLVLDALGAIDLDRRAVFVLYEIDGVPMDEIAASLSIPVNTAYSRLRLARAEFRAAVTRLRLRRGEP